MDIDFQTTDSYLIRYCLENRSSMNDQIVKNVLKPLIIYQT